MSKHFWGRMIILFVMVILLFVGSIVLVTITTGCTSPPIQ